MKKAPTFSGPKLVGRSLAGPPAYFFFFAAAFFFAGAFFAAFLVAYFIDRFSLTSKFAIRENRSVIHI